MAKAPWSGSGGRWTVWPLRIVLWAALLIVIYRGATAIAFDETPSPAATTSTGAPAASTPASQFPATLAEGFIMQFGPIYFNFNPATAGLRENQLASFLTPAALATQAPQFGYTGTAAKTALESESVVGVDARDQHAAVVTLLVLLNNRLTEFGVPVYAANGNVVVTGLPALLPAPKQATPPAVQRPAPDLGATAQLEQQLPGFFTAYASASQTALNRYLVTPGSLAVLGGQVTNPTIPAGGLYVPSGGDARDITVTVDWQLPGQQGGFATTYDMSVIDQQGGKWNVKNIQASTQPLGTAQ
ncbi:MAG TPA: conjugal transfer protein [Trebonia sp.]|nr:conjugal transfer protein [Trebonia sp.]